VVEDPGERAEFFTGDEDGVLLAESPPPGKDDVGWITDVAAEGPGILFVESEK
jgi:hypothetical protein